MQHVILTQEPITAARLADGLREHLAGAVATFEGLVRAETRPAGGGRPAAELTALDYCAYEEMAREQMALLRDQAMRAFDILNAAMAHRIGRLSLGEVSVAIAVAASHRPAAFDACRWLIDQLKADVPIWKKNVWSDGQESWTDAPGA